MLKQFIQSNIDNVLFMRNSYRRFIYIAIFLLIINFLLSGYLYFDLLTVPKTQCFATTTDGRIISITPE